MTVPVPTVKFTDDDDSIIEGIAAPFGGPFNGKDLSKQFFSAKTDFALDWFPERPLLFEHGFDSETATEPVGRVTQWEIKADLGLWVQAQLNKSSQYWSAIKELIDSNKLFFSTSALSHLVQESKSSGELLRWPWCELSLTSHPCNPLATLEMVEKHFEGAGIKSTKLDELKTLSESSDAGGGFLTEKATPSSGYDTSESRPGAHSASDYAYVDSSGRGHLLIGDAAHVRAALARFNQTRFESPAKKKAAARKILSKASALNISVSDTSAVSKAAKSAAVKDLPSGPTLMGDDDGGPYPEGSYEDLATDISTALQRQSLGYAYVVATFPGYALARCCDDDGCMQYWRVAYTLDESGEPVLGEMEMVEAAMIPAGKSADLELLQTDEAPLAIQSARLSEYAALVLERTKGVQERRIKEGRIISASNRTRLSDTADALEGALKALRDLLSTTEPQPAKAASVDRSQQRLREFDGLKLWADVELAS